MLFLKICIALKIHSLKDYIIFNVYSILDTDKSKTIKRNNIGYTIMIPIPDTFRIIGWFFNVYSEFLHHTYK